MGAWPFGDKFLRHNPVLLWLERQGFYQAGTFPLGSFVAKRMRARINESSTKKDSETQEFKDLLDNFLKARETHPKFMTEREVLNISLTMILAGAETMQGPPPVPNPIHRCSKTQLMYSSFIVP